MRRSRDSGRIGTPTIRRAFVSTFRLGQFGDLLGQSICGVTFDGQEGLVLCLASGMKLKLMDSTRRDRIMVMLPVCETAMELQRLLETGTGKELDDLASRYNFGRRIMDLETDSDFRERIRPWVLRELRQSDQPGDEPP